MTMTQIMRPAAGRASWRLGRDSHEHGVGRGAVVGHGVVDAGPRLVVPVGQVGEPQAEVAAPAARRAMPPTPTQIVSPAVRSPRSAVVRQPRPLPCERSATGGLHGARLTRRGRVVVAVVWAAVLCLAVSMALSLGDGAAGPYAGPTTSVQIEPGDTLWSVANNLAPDADPRVVIDQIVTINGLSSAGDIGVGDRLEVPATP